MTNKHIPVWSGLAILIGIICLPSASAQDLPGEQIEVVKDFDARLVDTRKVRSQPRLPMRDTVHEAYTYTVSVDVPEMTYPAPTLRPLAIRSPKPPMSYRGYARAGYGLPNAILGELSYLVVQQDDLLINASADYLRADDKDKPLQKFSELHFGVTGSYFASPELSVSGGLAYGIEDYYFYGKEPDDLVLYIDEGRKYKTFTGHVELSNSERLAGDVNYNVGLSYYNHQDDIGAKENGAILALRGEKWIAGKYPVSLGIVTDFSVLRDNENESRNLHNFFLQPGIALRDDSYKLDVMLNIASSDDEFYFFPVVEGSAKILGNRLIAFAGVTGSLRKNNFYHLSTYNPFIHETVSEDIRNTHYTEYYGGIKGNLKSIEYQGKVAYTDANDLALFLPDEDDYRKFQPRYDSVNIFRIEGTVTATPPVKGLELGATVAKNFYDLANEEKAWHLPSLETKLYADFTTVEGHLNLRADLFIENGVPYINADDEADRLNSLFDLSLGADWYFSEHVGVFVDVNNLAGNKRQRWQRYPTYGINVIGGVVARF